MKMRYILAASLLASAAMPANAALYVFGDSLVDAGNVAVAAGQNAFTNPGYGYFQGRFSNGPTYADLLSQALYGSYTTASTLPVPPGQPRGVNFAYGAATAVDRPTDRVPSFADQVAAFSARNVTLTAQDLVLVTFGGNDIKAALGGFSGPTTPDADFSATYNALRSGLNTLMGKGVTRIIVTGQADIGAIPSTTARGSTDLNAYATRQSTLVNAKFDEITQTIDPNNPNQVIFFDLLQFQRDLLADPNSGFTNTTDRCINPDNGRDYNGNVGPNPPCGGYLYFDDTHPTKEAHAAIAGGIRATLAAAPPVPEPATWATMMLGFGLVGMAARRRRTALAA